MAVASLQVASINIGIFSEILLRATNDNHIFFQTMSVCPICSNHLKKTADNNS